MGQTLTANSQAILLLTARFSRGGAASERALTPTEWGRLARWLVENGATPADLLGGEARRLLAEWSDTKIPSSRLAQLLDRSAALALALEKWERSGVWVVTRADEEYPERFKQMLGWSAPPVFFGIGPRALLVQRGVAVVGSREASPLACAWTRDAAEKIARDGYSIVSGGARGIDDAAIEGALRVGGTATGVLADSLLRSSIKPSNRQAILAGHLVLISPYDPEARFEVGNAMARNKYIYCLSRLAIVVVSEQGRGGTWAGASEALRNAWVPVWVRAGDDAGAGNAALAKIGAHVIEREPFAPAEILPKDVRGDSPRDDGSQFVAEAEIAEYAPDPQRAVEACPPEAEAILILLSQQGREVGLTRAEIAARVAFKGPALSLILKDAVTSGLIEKTRSPVRYRVQVDPATQQSLFDMVDGGIGGAKNKKRVRQKRGRKSDV